jgi:hypothetical protein
VRSVVADIEDVGIGNIVIVGHSMAARILIERCRLHQGSMPPVGGASV